MEELLANSSFADLKQGSIIKGKIIEIRQNEVVVDIGGKSEGVVPVNEFADINDLQIGEEIEVLLEKLEDREGNPVISYDKAQQKKNWENILATCSEGRPRKGQSKGRPHRFNRRRLLPARFANRHPAAEKPRPVCRADIRLQGC